MATVSVAIFFAGTKGKAVHVHDHDHDHDHVHDHEIRLFNVDVLRGRRSERSRTSEGRVPSTKLRVLPVCYKLTSGAAQHCATSGETVYIEVHLDVEVDVHVDVDGGRGR
jgi:transcription initiation factor IIF auxiliary subunit